MKKVILYISIVLLHPSFAAEARFDPCEAYGAVYFTKDKNEADFVIYIEESEGLAGLRVYKIDSPLYATEPGVWHITEIRALARYKVYIETERKGMADFTVAYTTSEAAAGCE
ncbi:MAG TPA: DUF6150 family protein [Cytophagales bacterium]|nr:DUF6150 family protein [Cytophagales bacterium]